MTGSRLFVRPLPSGDEIELETGTWRKNAIAYIGNDLVFAGTPLEGTEGQIFSVRPGGEPIALT